MAHATWCPVLRNYGSVDSRKCNCKPAATGSGEPIGMATALVCSCGRPLRYVPVAYIHTDGTNACVHTPPASQPTVTPHLERWAFFHRSQLPEGMSPRPDGEWVKYADVLALLRAAEQK